jgi:hypothetical protein
MFANMSSHHEITLDEARRASLQRLLNLGPKLSLMVKYFNEKHRVSDKDMGKVLGVDINQAGDLNGTFVGMVHYLTTHDYTPASIGAELTRQGMKKSEVARLVSALSHLNGKARAALKLIDMSYRVARIAPHWESIFARVDCRPIREKDELLGLAPMVIFKLGVADPDKDEKRFLMFEMNFPELEGFVETVRNVQDRVLHDWESMRKDFGSKLIG